jgi:hypothetical protein
MKKSKESVTLELSKELTIEIEGTYYPEEPMIWTLPNGDPGYPGSPSEFEIQDIKITKGNLCDLIDYLNGNTDLWEHLTELAINKIEE